jgi:ATP synthase delta (OSCP) subunit
MSTISDQLVTVSDRVYLLSELDSISRSFFTSTGSHDLAVLGIRSTSEGFWTEVLKAGQQNRESLEKLRQEIQSFRVIRVTLAFDPDRAFLGKMAAVFKTYCGENCILDIEVVPSLSAGIQYTVDGKSIDRSLLTKMKEIDLKKVLMHYLPVLST